MIEETGEEGEGRGVAHGNKRVGEGGVGPAERVCEAEGEGFGREGKAVASQQPDSEGVRCY
eukprot:1412338-Rhodomonas_salina.1